MDADRSVDVWRKVLCWPMDDWAYLLIADPSHYLQYTFMTDLKEVNLAFVVFLILWHYCPCRLVRSSGLTGYHRLEMAANFEHDGMVLVAAMFGGDR